MSYAFLLVVAIVAVALTFWSTKRRKQRLEELLKRHDSIIKNSNRAAPSLMETISPIKDRGAPIDPPKPQPQLQPQVSVSPPPDNPEQLQSKAEGLLLHGRYHEMIKILQPQVNRTPQLVDLRLLLAEAYARTGNLSALTQQELDIKALGDEAAVQQLKTIIKTAVPQPASQESGNNNATNVVKLPVNDLEEMNLLADTDENSTKLDLARAYLEVGDLEAAREILKEVQDEGNAAQQEECLAILARFPS